MPTSHETTATRKGIPKTVAKAMHKRQVPCKLPPLESYGGKYKRKSTEVPVIKSKKTATPVPKVPKVPTQMVAHNPDTFKMKSTENFPHLTEKILELQKSYKKRKTNDQAKRLGRTIVKMGNIITRKAAAAIPAKYVENPLVVFDTAALDEVFSALEKQCSSTALKEWEEASPDDKSVQEKSAGGLDFQVMSTMLFKEIKAEWEKEEEIVYDGIWGHESKLDIYHWITAQMVAKGFLAYPKCQVEELKHAKFWTDACWELHLGEEEMEVEEEEEKVEEEMEVEEVKEEEEVEVKEEEEEVE
eukprot:3941211-Rhodomonas_salina.1